MKTKKSQAVETGNFPLPMFKTAELMSKLTGIGENTIRQLMDNRRIDYISLGNRRLIADSAMWDWYERNKTCAIGREKEAV